MGTPLTHCRFDTASVSVVIGRALRRGWPLSSLALVGVLSWPTSAQPAAAAPAAAASAAPGAELRAQCERAVRQALQPANGAAGDLRLTLSPTGPRSAGQDNAVVLQGDGQWRDGSALRQFKFSCSLDPTSADAVGVVIRQAAAPAAAPPSSVQEPDLSHLSPAACESSAAHALKERWPRVSQISFDTMTRSLTQQSAARAELRGQGRAQPAPESPVLVHFGFDCTVDPRDGSVIGMRLSG
jgi:hypothetical protein